MDDILRNGILSVISNYSKQTGFNCVFCPTYPKHIDYKSTSKSSCDICNLIQSTPDGKASCLRQRNATVERAFKEYNYQIVNCHAGLIEWVVPVFYTGIPVGYFAAGFVLTEQVNILKIENRQNIFANRFHLPSDAVDAALTNQMVAADEDIVPLAQLLFSLTQLNIPSGRNFRREISKNQIAENNFVIDEAKKISFSSSMPLSYYICNNNISKKQIDTFWKGIEISANDVFINSMSGNLEKSQAKFNQIMQLAYNEADIKNAKTAAEMLLHIIYLKFYNKDLYDTRFYNLTFETINKLIDSNTKESIQNIMDDAFHSIYLFFNVEGSHGERKTISPPIIKYLEENYKSEIKISDIEKITYMAPAYASRLFKKETSFTIKACLINIRMKHAQELLINTNMPIKDIALEVGYSDIRGFYKIFTKHFGITCSEMRKNRINNVK